MPLSQLSFEIYQFWWLLYLPKGGGSYGTGLWACHLIHADLPSEEETAMHSLTQAKPLFRLGNRPQDLWCRSGEFCVYKVVASHLRWPKIRIICLKFSQPASSPCSFTRKHSIQLGRRYDVDLLIKGWALRCHSINREGGRYDVILLLKWWALRCRSG